MIKLIFLGLAAWWAYLVSQDNWGEGLYILVISALLYFNLITLDYGLRVRKALGAAVAKLKQAGLLK